MPFNNKVTDYFGQKFKIAGIKFELLGRDDNGDEFE
jgi:hypothetical protein